MTKLSNYIKQYGWFVGIRRILFSFCRKIYCNEVEYIYIINNNSIASDKDQIENVFDVTKLFIEKYNVGEKYCEFISFINNGDQGFAFVVDERVAGSAWIQKKGLYPFLKGYLLFDIPNDCVVFKNLYVNPDFRGKGIGSRLNKVCLNNSFDKKVVIMILADNRYAIRNWKRLGAKKILEVRFKYWKIFNKKPSVKFKAIDQLGERFKNYIYLNILSK